MPKFDRSLYPNIKFKDNNFMPTKNKIQSEILNSNLNPKIDFQPKKLDNV